MLTKDESARLQAAATICAAIINVYGGVSSIKSDRERMAALSIEMADSLQREIEAIDD